MNEREVFLEWHFNDWKANNANGDSIEFAKKLYGRVYSHDHTSCVRELELKSWQASANREGYKMIPVDELKRIARETESYYTCRDIEELIGAVDDH